ncbi:hypothetical protein [Streptococcus cuniculi]|uniref:Uncharacterized protein n=2 Tax=Streptococcus cuniculi TaxID=1432788 RepID=A0A4Y9J724_9STRE|nr:hypothetical protein [Streptococcus cuniculi]MBF0779366.1 hypothetical protein [Streptococcus cuniculi]TFU96622.1 hypothetical protein E4T82_11790 [Streptococcus cuniculi]
MKEQLKAIFKNKKGMTGLVAGIVVLGTGGYVLSQPGTKPTSTPKVEQSTSSSSVDKEDELMKKAEKAVKLLEDNQVKENVSPAETAVKGLKAGDSKDKLTKRIDAVKVNMAKKEAEAELAKEAEAAVAKLEAEQVDGNIQPAQTATDKVVDKATKGKLQHRINLVKDAIAARAAQAVAQAKAEEEARAAAEAQAQQAAAQQQAQVQETPSYQAPAQAPAQTTGGDYTPPAQAPAQQPQQSLTQDQRQQQLNDADANFNNGTYDY